MWHLSRRHSGLFPFPLWKSPSRAGSADTQAVILKTHWRFKELLGCSFFLTSCSYQKHTSSHEEKTKNDGKYPKYTQRNTWQNLLVGVKTQNNVPVPEHLLCVVKWQGSRSLFSIIFFIWHFSLEKPDAQLKKKNLLLIVKKMCAYWFELIIILPLSSWALHTVC